MAFWGVFHLICNRRATWDFRKIATLLRHSVVWWGVQALKSVETPMNRLIRVAIFRKSQVARRLHIRWKTP